MKFNHFALPVVRSILFIVLGLIFATISNKTLEQASIWWSVICIVSNIITILVLMVIFKKGNLTFKSILTRNNNQSNFKNTMIIIFLMIIFGIGGMYGFAFLIYGYLPVTMIHPIPIWIALINLFLLPITIVFAELPLYFGYSLNNIEKNTGNKFLTISYPLFFYALQHSFIPLLWDWKHIIYRFFSFLPLLIYIGVIYYKKRNLRPLMIGHFILDLATSSQILLTSLFPSIFDLMK